MRFGRSWGYKNWSQMKKLTIILIEIGMLCGIVFAGYTLPDSTPLSIFLMASGTCFVLGNVLLIKKLNEAKSGKIGPSSKFWTHMLRVLVILAICWLLTLIFHRG